METLPAGPTLTVCGQGSGRSPRADSSDFATNPVAVLSAISSVWSVSALIAGFVRSIAPDLLDVRLDPGDNRCCVTLTALPGGEHAAQG
jgi:hypothetical protein